MFVLPFDLVAETGRKILFVADHYIDVAGEVAIDFLSLRLAADGLPERIAIVEIIRDDRAVFFCDLHRFLGDLGRRFGKCAEDPAGVKPTSTFLAKYLFPIDVALFKLRNGGMPTVRAAERRADAKAALGKVHPVAYSTADAVVFDPFDVRLINPALIN